MRSLFKDTDSKTAKLLDSIANGEREVDALAALSTAQCDFEVQDRLEELLDSLKAPIRQILENVTFIADNLNGGSLFDSCWTR